MSVEIVALYGVILCLLMPSVSSMLMAVVNLVLCSTAVCLVNFNKDHHEIIAQIMTKTARTLEHIHGKNMICLPQPPKVPLSWWLMWLWSDRLFVKTRTVFSCIHRP